MLPPGLTTAAPGAVTQPLVIVSPPFEIAATFVGAVSGALVAVRRRFDIVGVMTLALVAGLGGGIIRDVLLQRYGIAAFQHDYLLLTAVIAALIGFFFAERHPRHPAGVPARGRDRARACSPSSAPTRPSSRSWA